MDRNALGLMGVLVALALMGQGRPVPAAASKETKQPPSATAIPAGTCPDPGEGPWKAAAEDFGKDTCPVDRSNNTFQCLKNVKPDFLVATVPDPETTHLALYFDRSIQSLNWAISDGGYALEHYWLPWTSSTDKNLVLLADRQCREKLTETRRKQPALLIFHKQYSPPLWVWLAGESPTNGINKEEFQKAIDYVTANGDKADPIKIVGPSFSGSLAPLARDLRMRFPDGIPAFHIVSGLVTSQAAIRHFHDEVPGVSYESVIDNDERSNNLLFSYAREMWHIGKGRRIGILAEDETAYGGSIQIPSRSPELSPGAEIDPHDWITFRYPREVSRLRNAYQEEPNVTPDGRQAPAPGVNFTLKDGASDSGSSAEKDSVAAFSPLQSPASQQAALSDVARTMRQERIDFAGIVATDVLDGLFLGRFLRAADPGIRLFTLNSDLLFLQQQDSTSLAGMLSITDYPLVSLNQHWTGLTGPDGAQRRVQFDSSYSEGVYNACRRLLPPDPYGPEGLIDYTRPGKDPGDQPPLWLSVVGRDGYWPLALLDDPPEKDYPGMLSSRPDPSRVDTFHPETPRRGWLIAFLLLLLLAVAHWWYLTGLLAPAKAVSEEKQTAAGRIVQASLGNIFRVYPDPEELASPNTNPQLKSFLLASTIAIASLVWVMASPLVLLMGDNLSRKWALPYLLMAVVVFALLLLLGIRLSVWQTKNADPEIPSWVPYAVMASVSWSAGISVWLVWVALLAKSKYDSGYFFAYRSFGLTSGVAPEVPLLFAGIAFFYASCEKSVGH
jgi:hypothetical protein